MIKKTLDHFLFIKHFETVTISKKWAFLDVATK